MWSEISEKKKKENKIVGRDDCHHWLNTQMDTKTERRTCLSWFVWCSLFVSCRYGESPFEYVLGESEGNLQLAILNAQIKWPPGPDSPYPEQLHQFVTWMLQPQVALRPYIGDVLVHVDKLITKFSAWAITTYNNQIRKPSEESQ